MEIFVIFVDDGSKIIDSELAPSINAHVTDSDVAVYVPKLFNP